MGCRTPVTDSGTPPASLDPIDCPFSSFYKAPMGKSGNKHRVTRLKPLYPSLLPSFPDKAGRRKERRRLSQWEGEAKARTVRVE
mmetsp:Transcript_39649/g.78084  ORF Transcript_39649/g.78084 Transcript_39649/m.78084 type:complete len:84 (-) Transcript_39649:1570-1821(-)